MIDKARYSYSMTDKVGIVWRGRFRKLIDNMRRCGIDIACAEEWHWFYSVFTVGGIDSSTMQVFLSSWNSGGANNGF